MALFLSSALTFYFLVSGVSLVAWAIIKAVMGIRVSKSEEYSGVDLVECGLEAYLEITGAAK